MASAATTTPSSSSSLNLLPPFPSSSPPASSPSPSPSPRRRRSSSSSLGNGHDPGAFATSALPSVRLWPPNPNTRSVLVHRLAEHLSSVSFFSQRYGQISAEEASIGARRIEQEAFSAASRRAELPDCSDIAAVQFYAKEASRLMLDRMKKGPSPSFASSQSQAVAEESVNADADVADQGSGSASPDAEVAEQGPGSLSSSAATSFDISGGCRDFLTRYEAQELLRPLAAPGNAISSVCFSNRSFGIDAARVAGKLLEALKPQLVRVDLSDIVAGRMQEEALAVMSIFSSALRDSKLRYLNLSDNALGEKGVRAFSELLASQKELEELYFNNNGMSERAAVALRELLPSPAKLKVFHFHNNMTGDGGAISISRLVREAPLLEDFRFSSCRVCDDGGIHLAEALLSGSSLRRIDLRDNLLREHFALALAKALKQHTGLKEVYVSDIGTCDEGTVAILEALEASPDLEVLELAGNDIWNVSVPKIVSFLESKPNLVRLNLADNDLKDRGVFDICSALREGHDKLTELDLSSTNIGRVGACAAARAIASKPHFKFLGLNDNHISYEGMKALRKALKRGSHCGISVLGCLDENHIDEAEDDDDDYDSLFPQEEEEEEEEEGEDDGAGNAEIDDELQAQFRNVKV